MTDVLGFIFQHYLGHIIIAITIIIVTYVIIITIGESFRRTEVFLKNLQINTQTTDKPKKQTKKKQKPRKPSCIKDQFFGYLKKRTKPFPPNCQDCIYILTCSRKEEPKPADPTKKSQEKKENDIEETMKKLTRRNNKK